MLLRQVEETGANFSMKLQGLTVESILDVGGSSPRQARGHREIEDQREVRLIAWVARRLSDAKHGKTNPSRISLIGQSGIAETIADDDGTFCQRWFDDLR